MNGAKEGFEKLNEEYSTLDEADLSEVELKEREAITRKMESIANKIYFNLERDDNG